MRPQVVIVGAGFGGLSAARALAHADVDVTIVDRQNHHLFQPLLYPVATAGLSPADIAAPVRAILRRQANARVVLGKVEGVDPRARTVRLEGGAMLGYDWLVLATGARHSYFGNDGWAEHAPGIKTIDDATAVRRKVLLAFERAEIETDPERRRALLTFVVVGGGPTGVEMAGAIAELARLAVSEDFRTITPHCARIVLVEAGDRLLPSFPPILSARAQRAIEQLGVEVRAGIPVSAIDAVGVTIGNAYIPTHTIVWAAGVRASPAAQWLGAVADRAGRVIVGPNLQVLGHADVFAIGDTAACSDGNGRLLPGIAPVAKQQGRHVARVIRGTARKAFRYRDRGSLATIGRHRAVIAFGRLRLSGSLAWLIWCTAHVYFLAGFRNRLAVGATWLWSYLTFERGARLITGSGA